MTGVSAARSDVVVSSVAVLMVGLLAGVLLGVDPLAHP
jgi:hypothetical protein